MDDAKVAVFFYGSYMNPAVLAEAHLAPTELEVAELPDYEIEINPLANLVPAEGERVYGVLTHATHAQLDRLYAHARDVLGGIYLPHPVLVETQAGDLVPALCYIASGLEPRTPTREYVDRILTPARAHRFPSWYVERIESFRP
jgi:hypothetical protein